MQNVFKLMKENAWVFPLPTLLLLWSEISGLAGTLIVTCLLLQLEQVWFYMFVCSAMALTAPIVIACRAMDEIHNDVYKMAAPVPASPADIPSAVRRALAAIWP